MKSFVKQVINEARIQRTIDPKIWATMSSASSKNRANGAVDVKPMRRDDSEVLLQKYVAGLLTIKAECPATEADIDTIGSYKLIIISSSIFLTSTTSLPSIILPPIY